MTETQQLIARIKALAARTGRADSTLSAKVLGSGHALAKLEAGGTITLAKLERVRAVLDELEAAPDQAKAA